MEFSVTEKSGVTVMKALGAYVTGGHEVAPKVMETLGGRSSHVILDFSGVTYVDSSFMGALVSLQSDFESDIRCRLLVICSPAFLKGLKSVGADSMLDIVASEEDAIQMLGRT